MRAAHWCTGLALALSLNAEAQAQQAPGNRRPNIVVILGDDLGFADTGMFGSEIRTPNIDALATDGVRFTNFYTHASCSPTRAMLLSGTDTHRNGLGNMDEWTAPNQVGVPGYEGYLNDRVTTLPQLLKDAGYHTYMVGKWHLGKAPDKIPAARGFERDFSLLDGAGSYWDMTNFTASNPRSTFTEDGKYLRKLPKGYYATKTYTDKLIGFIDANHGDGKPFFAYVAPQAPHDPFHLPREWRERHVGEYDQGWDAVRQKRLERQVELGIMPAGTQLAERMWFLPDPTVLAPASRAVLGRKMELYAGMVENLDFHIGRLVQHLKDIGEYENTIFIVFGDNGAEGTDLFAMIAGSPGTRDFLFAAANWSQTDPKAWGDPRILRELWTRLGAGVHDALQPVQGFPRRGRHPQRPHRQRPRGEAGPGERRYGLMHVADVMPTLLEVAGATYPTTGDRPPLIGKSWVRCLAGEVESPRTDKDYMAWQASATARSGRATGSSVAVQALREGGLGAVRAMWPAIWSADLAAEQPARVKELLALWDDYVKVNNVILPSRSPFEGMEETLPERFPVEAGYPPLIYKRQFVPPAEMMADPKPIWNSSRAADARDSWRRHAPRSEANAERDEPAAPGRGGDGLRRDVGAGGIRASAAPVLLASPLSGAQAVPLIYMSMSGNANPIDPARLVVPGGNVEATVAPVGYARTFTLFDRAAMAAALVPMGSLSGS